MNLSIHIPELILFQPKKIEMDDVLMNYIMDDIELTNQVMADITRQARIMMDKIYETKLEEYFNAI